MVLYTCTCMLYSSKGKSTSEVGDPCAPMGHPLNKSLSMWVTTWLFGFLWWISSLLTSILVPCLCVCIVPVCVTLVCIITKVSEKCIHYNRYMLHTHAHTHATLFFPFKHTHTCMRAHSSLLYIHLFLCPYLCIHVTHPPPLHRGSW